jgi:hypothetical protein
MTENNKSNSLLPASIKSFLHQHWIIVLLIIGTIIVFGVAPKLNFRITILEQTFTVLGWLLFVVQYFYNESELVYSAFNHLRLWISNEPVNWKFAVEYSIKQQENDIFDKCWRVVQQCTNNAVIWSRTSSILIINVDNHYTLRFILYEDQVSHAVTLMLQISDSDKPYRYMRKMIENQIIPILGAFSKSFSDGAKYSARVIFNGSNPFFGIYLRRLELPKIVSFSLDFTENYMNGKQFVTIRKDRVEIVADSLLALHTLSMKYLSTASTT